SSLLPLVVMIPPPPIPPPFPYTTLFRSLRQRVELVQEKDAWPGVHVIKQEPQIFRCASQKRRDERIHPRRNKCEPELGGNVLCRSEEHTSELQSLTNLVCRLLLEKKKSP